MTELLRPPDLRPVNPPESGFRDPASFSQPGTHFTRHIHLDFTIDFERNRIHGKAQYRIETLDEHATQLILDTRRVTINTVTSSSNPLQFDVREDVSPVGGQLCIQMPGGRMTEIEIHFETDGCGTGSPGGGACDWLSEEQAGGQPFMFTQAQAVHARSIFPCQDTPAVKAPYSAVVRVAEPYSHLTVVMSAQRVSSLPEDVGGSARFECPVPIPSYLFALACGTLDSRSLSKRSCVWALPDVVEKAAWEFEEVEKMLSVAEEIAGPYVWGRYDLLVLPPSFPYGGMENPMLTFVTPTLLAGDRSLVSVIVHEIAHSWTGNLISCKDCRHFWINEGFTVKLERRILSQMYGPGREGLDAKAGRANLSKYVNSVGADHKYTSLVSKLQNGEDPDNYFSCVPYEKGYNFLMVLEDTIRKDENGDFHAFLRDYFQEFRYQSVSSSDFINFFRKRFPKSLGKIDIDEWLHGTGDCPCVAPVDESLVSNAVQLCRDWIAFFSDHDLDNKSEENIEELKSLRTINFAGWDSKQKLSFLNELYSAVGARSKVREGVTWNSSCAQILNEAYELDAMTNSEIRFLWCRLGLLAKYDLVRDNVERFVTEQGRMKFIRPLFHDLHHVHPKGRYATELFLKHKESYHSIATKLIARDLGIGN